MLIHSRGLEPAFFVGDDFQNKLDVKIAFHGLPFEPKVSAQDRSLICQKRHQFSDSYL